MQPGFFARDTVTVARDLIGCQLVVVKDGQPCRHVITETEAYDGPEDLACHASKGRTKRTEVLFGEPGTLYVYLCYGMHWLVNLVTGPSGYPAAVLIRGVQSLDGARKHDGPGKLTRALGITGSMNGKRLGLETGLWVEPRPAVIAPLRIQTGPRIGVAYAGPLWSQVPYRFLLLQGEELCK
jgi:DNA-3-methyladenine glycosylase